MRLVIQLGVSDQLGLSQIFNTILPLEVELGGSFVVFVLFLALLIQHLKLVRCH